MPNHITTVAIVSGPAETVEAFRAAHIRERDDKKGVLLDFSTIIPKPGCVDETSSGSEETLGLAALFGEKLYVDFRQQFPWLEKDGCHLEGARYSHARQVRAWLEKKRPKALEEGRKAARCAAETGFPDWYEWSIANWGTKWGAYGYEERSRKPGEFVFKFETAWSPPRPILAKLAEMWPELRIETKSIDEGGGAWVGSGGQVESTEETRELHLAVYGHTERIDPEPEDTAV